MPRLLCLVLFLLSCAPRFSVAPGAQLECESEADCSVAPGLSCASAIGRCIAGTDDGVGPRLLSAVAGSKTTVTLSFDEPLAPQSATLPGAYEVQTVGGTGLAVNGATLFEGQRVELAVDRQAPGAAYVVRVSQVTDLWGNAVAMNTEQTFTGFGAGADDSAPTPIAPLMRQRLSGPAALVWSRKPSARSYRVEVAHDSSFSAPQGFDVVAASDEEEPPTSLALTVDLPLRYYWRVRADTTAADQWGVSSFEGMDDSVYVYCAAGQSCAAGSAAGNRSEPLQSLAQGVALASVLGLSTVKIAARGSGASYAETTVQLVGGIDLLGGFEPQFVTRDPSVHETIVQGLGLVTLRAELLQAPVLIDGVTVVGGAARNQDDTVAIDVYGTGGRLVLRNLKVRGGSAENGHSVGVRVSSGAAVSDERPVVETSDIEGGTSLGGDSIGIDVRQSAPDLRANLRLAGGRGQHSVGITTRDGAPLIHDNAVIQGGVGVVSTSGVSISGGSADLHDNALVAGGDVTSVYGTESQGVRCDGMGTVTIADSPALRGGTVGGRYAQSHGAYLRFCTATIRQSTLIGGDVTATGLVVGEGFVVESGGAWLETGTYTITSSRLQGGSTTVTPVAGSIPGSIAYHRSVGVTAFAANALVDVSGSTLLGGTASSPPGYQAKSIGAYGRFSGGEIRDSILQTPNQPSGASSALELIEGSSVAITHSALRAGAARDEQLGVRVLGSSPRIEANTIECDDGVGPCVGLKADGASSASASVMALDFVNNLVVTSNHAGSRAAVLSQTRAANSLTARLVNNTLVSRGGDRGVVLTGLGAPGLFNAVLVNDLIALTATGPCVEETTGSSRPAVFQANALVGCTANLYARFGAAALTTPSGVDAVGAGFGATIGLAATSSCGFASETVPRDFRLLASAPQPLRQGGRNTAVDCGSQSCGAVTRDADQAQRTCPSPNSDPALAVCYSIGAYERD